MATPKKAAKATVLETPEAKIAEISREIVNIETKAKAIVVTNAEQVKEATVFLASVKARLDRVEELRLFFTKPLLDQKKKIDDLFKAQSVPLEGFFRMVKRAVADYALKQEQAARAEEARLQGIRDAANAKREAEGKEQILAPVATVQREEATVHTDAGRSTLKKVWKFEVTDATLVPREYLAVDDKLIRKSVLLGTREIPGVRIYEDFDMSVSSNL